MIDIQGKLGDIEEHCAKRTSINKTSTDCLFAHPELTLIVKQKKTLLTLVVLYQKLIVIQNFGDNLIFKR